jgi:hypothetical protein
LSQYYYLTASLPLLLPEGEVLMDSPAFLGACRGILSPGDYAQLTACRLVPGDNPPPRVHPLLGRWLAWEKALRNELVRVRAARLRRDGEPFLRPGEDGAGAAEIVREAASLPNPLEAEFKLDKARWAFLDELEVGHIFDLQRIMVYYLKLQILERRSRFTREKGGRAYGKLYQDVVNQIT